MPRKTAATSASLPVPSDYILARDYCSYGYFLLAPNHWDPVTSSMRRTLELDGGAVTLRTTQPPHPPTLLPRLTSLPIPPSARQKSEARASKSRKSSESVPATNYSAAPAGSTVPGSPLRIEADRALSTEEWGQATRLISRMLRLDEDAALVRSFHALDPRWKRSRAATFHPGRSASGPGRGRLMRSPTLFEDVIKTVTSCNVTWPSTITMNRRLCEVLGEVSPSGAHAFPSARKLARTRAASLRARCSVGYRDARIVELARLFTLAPAHGGIDVEWYENPRTSDQDVFDALLKLPGIGPYAAANVMQLLGRYARLPLDTESVRHGKSILGMTGSDREIMKRLTAHFAPFGPHAFRSYWFELWAFYESRHGPAWTWERETTGKAFTAALLKDAAGAKPEGPKPSGAEAGVAKPKRGKTPAGRPPAGASF